MGKVVLDITMSLDGYISGPNVTPKQPMGEGGLRLHDWIFGAKTAIDTQVTDETVATSGAVIIGRRTYDTAIDDAWGGVTPFEVPAFVVSTAVPEEAMDSFIFVTDGIESALRQAQAIAGDKNVWVMGGANIVQQYIKAGLFEELRIHIAPVLFGAGTKLFDHIGTTHIELETTRVIQSPGATHLSFCVVK